RIDRRLDAQVADVEQDAGLFRGRSLQVGHHPRPPFRLVVRLRIQSATRLTEMARMAIAAAGMRAAPMPKTMPSLFSFTMPPQSASGGCTPSPRKDSADRNRMA